MWKTVLAGSTALAIAGATLAYAQQGPGGGGMAPHWRAAPQPGLEGRSLAPGWHPSAQDMNAFADARVAALHAGLQLTAEQEKSWPAVETALRDLAKQRMARFAARASADRPTDPVERLAVRADMLTQRGAALKKLADAAGPLYKSLDDGQKHRFVMLARLGGRHWRGERRMHDFGGYRMQRGPDGKIGPMAPGGGATPQ